MDNSNDRSSKLYDPVNSQREVDSLRLLLKQKSAELEATQKSLESISYTISHDLRAPLRAIDSFSQSLAEDFTGHIPEEAMHHISRIRKSANHMRGMIDELLELARVSRRKMDIQEVNLSRLAREIIEELCEHEPDRKIEFIIADKLITLGDKTLLKIALTQLLQNAWKFSRLKEKARIEFGFEKTNGSHEYFIKDNGVGFEMEQAEQLFQPFKRLHSEKDFPGMGVGLAIAKQIIERHHGLIRAESEPNQGACFYFNLGEEYQA